MITTTTDSVPNRNVHEILGLVAGEAVLGANVFKDLFANIRDVVGGRSGSYQQVLRGAREMALADMVDQARQLGADAIIGVDIDYEQMGQSGGMLMVSCNGTAVKLA